MGSLLRSILGSALLQGRCFGLRLRSTGGFELGSKWGVCYHVRHNVVPRCGICITEMLIPRTHTHVCRRRVSGFLVGKLGRGGCIWQYRTQEILPGFITTAPGHDNGV